MLHALRNLLITCIFYVHISRQEIKTLEYKSRQELNSNI